MPDIQGVNIIPPKSLSMFFRIDERVYRSSMPSGELEFDFLCSCGIRSIISFHSLRDKDRALAEERKIKVIDCPLGDGEEPSDEFLAVFFDHMKEELDAGRVVLIHCMAGQQRTGLMAGFYLIKFHGMAPLKAYWEVDRNHLADYPHYKTFLLSRGQKLFEEQKQD